MELKNALAVCLISLFSATLVVLIARALDLQAAARLEPQLDRIVQELEALRQQGGIVSERTASQTETATSDDLTAMSDGLIVYYFHGSTRCPTCEAIERQTKSVVQSDFAAELASGEMQWKTLNYEEPPAAELTEKFEILNPVVVVARREDGKITDWKRLDRVWGLVDDEPAFARFVRDEIRQLLE